MLAYDSADDGQPRSHYPPSSFFCFLFAKRVENASHCRSWPKLGRRRNPTGPIAFTPRTGETGLILSSFMVWQYASFAYCSHAAPFLALDSRLGAGRAKCQTLRTFLKRRVARPAPSNSCNRGPGHGRTWPHGSQASTVKIQRFIQNIFKVFKDQYSLSPEPVPAYLRQLQD